MGGHLGCAQFLDPDPDLMTKNVWYTKNATPPRRLDGYEPNLGTMFPWWGGIWVVVSFWIQIRIRILCLSQNLTFFTLFNCWSDLSQIVQVCGTCEHEYVCYSIFWSRPKCTFYNMSNISALNVTKSFCPLFHSLVNKPFILNLGWLFMRDTAIGSVLKFQPPN